MVLYYFCPMATPDIKKSPYKIFIYYTIGALVIFGLINCICLIKDSSVQTLFFFILLAYLLFGILHIYLLKIFFTNLQTQKSLFFTVFLTLLGFIAVFLLNLFVFNKSSHSLYSLGLVVFPLPFLFVYTLQLFLNVPAKIFKEWYYPMDHTMPNLDLLDLTKVLIIQFEFLKSINDTTPTNFKAKAPFNMPFGQLFYIFINDYNDSHAQNIIEVINTQQIPYPWVFHKKSPWWQMDKYVDPDSTFQENSIMNNDIIICQRVKN